MVGTFYKLFHTPNSAFGQSIGLRELGAAGNVSEVSSLSKVLKCLAGELPAIVSLYTCRGAMHGKVPLQLLDH